MAMTQFNSVASGNQTIPNGTFSWDPVSNTFQGGFLCVNPKTQNQATLTIQQTGNASNTCAFLALQDSGMGPFHFKGTYSANQITGTAGKGATGAGDDDNWTAEAGPGGPPKED